MLVARPGVPHALQAVPKEVALVGLVGRELVEAQDALERDGGRHASVGWPRRWGQATKRAWAWA